MTTDEPIAFEYASSEPDDERRRCPICRKIILRHEEATCYREGGEDKIQCCTDCVEDFQRSSGHVLDADVLESSLFDAFHRWALREIQFKSDLS